MTRRWRALVAVALLLLVHAGLAFVLDALGVFESLLSPSMGRSLLVLPLVLLFFVVRLLLFFVVPGLLVAMMLFGRERG